MSTDIAEPRVGRKKNANKPDVEMAKIHADIMRDARIVVAVTDEGLGDYLSRLLRPLVAKDKADVLRQELSPVPKSKPKR